MPSCVFRKCTNYCAKVNKAQGITYHIFPSNEVCKEEWIAIVRKQRSELDWMPSNSSRICSIHFKSDDIYTSNKGRTLIKKNALPVIEKHGTQNIPNSPSSLDNVSISDMEEILESPRKAALKKCIKKLTIEKKKLQKKNKVLIQQNKRLKKKVARMADILKILKKRNYISREKEKNIFYRCGSTIKQSVALENE